ncbi:glycosyltransferase family 2 protein [[Phormidium] sp. ETS-05]|uniref:glycosyltransferase family 2 protein n=1 Tax=[Phormidium] sp. ETS-05 TaxID=222819 RepID=UPI0018EF0E3D|nr:glycosyltransferase family 2 protein [[Phormidium] sp. ETS-05]
MSKPSIAALITCHNRRDKTLACIEALSQQKDIKCEIYLTDDGSSDGTSAAVTERYPEVKLLVGDGSLFWVGGMRKAFAAAMDAGYDYYLWLNDDSNLFADTVSQLVKTHQTLAANNVEEAIVIGSLQDAATGVLTYGGVVRANSWHPLKFQLLTPGDEPKPCVTMNGNCVLIPHSVAVKVGNLEPQFIHRHADYDYGLRALQLGCSVWVAPGYAGTCSRNPKSGTWEDTNLPLSQLWKQVTGPKGLAPQEWQLFARRHAGPLWYFYWLLPYVRVMGASLWRKLRIGRITGAS